MMMSDRTSSVYARIARHWLWRLRREAEQDALDQAVALGVLSRVEGKDGSARFDLDPSISDVPIEKVKRLLRRGIGSSSRFARTAEGGVSWDGSGRSDIVGVRIINDDEDDEDRPGKRRPPSTRRVDMSGGDELNSELPSPNDAMTDTVGLMLEDRAEVPLASPPRGIDREELLRLVRAEATPPDAASVATLLMLADAVARSGHDLAQVQAILHRPKPVIAVIGAAPDLASCFVDLFRRGTVLPGSASMMDAYQLRSSRDLRSFEGSRRVLVHFGGRDHDDSSAIVDRQVSRAIRHAYPILATADDEDLIPRALLDAADLCLRCRPADPGLIVETMRVVLKRAVDPVIDVPDGCEVLSIADLALAIRPGMEPERCVAVLCALIAGRKALLDEPTSNAGKTKASSSSSTSGSGSFNSRRGKVGSGSTLIAPDRLETGADGKAPVTVETLAGYGEARAWALALKDDLALWKEGSLPWAQMSTRLLLAGPPGTGKTTYARALGNSLQLPVHATSVGAWLELSYLGDVLARMTAAFAEAQANAPSILFIDEIDGIGRRRHNGTGDHDDYWNSIVNRALELMDGAVRSQGVILVGATNHPAAIDPALLRSGRLENRVDIPMPDVDALVGILRHHLGRDADNVLASGASSPPGGEAAASVPNEEAETSDENQKARASGPEWSGRVQPSDPGAVPGDTASQGASPKGGTVATLLQRLRAWPWGRSRRARQSEAMGSAHHSGRRNEAEAWEAGDDSQ